MRRTVGAARALALDAARNGRARSAASRTRACSSRHAAGRARAGKNSSASIRARRLTTTSRVLGTDPDHQGRGLGSALMAPVLEHCDRDGVGAYPRVLEGAQHRLLRAPRLPRRGGDPPAARPDDVEDVARPAPVAVARSEREAGVSRRAWPRSCSRALPRAIPLAVARGCSPFRDRTRAARGSRSARAPTG